MRAHARRCTVFAFVFGIEFAYAYAFLLRAAQSGGCVAAISLYSPVPFLEFRRVHPGLGGRFPAPPVPWKFSLRES